VPFIHKNVVVQWTVPECPSVAARVLFNVLRGFATGHAHFVPVKDPTRTQSATGSPPGRSATRKTNPWRKRTIWPHSCTRRSSGADTKPLPAGSPVGPATGRPRGPMFVSSTAIDHRLARRNAIRDILKRHAPRQPSRTAEISLACRHAVPLIQRAGSNRGASSFTIKFPVQTPSKKMTT